MLAVYGSKWLEPYSGILDYQRFQDGAGRGAVIEQKFQACAEGNPMALLYYWEREQFLQDNRDRPLAGELQLSQGSEVLGRSRGGDRIWVFTRDCEKRYVLAAQLLVERIEESGNPLGRYTVTPKVGSTIRYRLLNPAVDFEPIVRSLTITNAAATLGQNFTGHSAVREVSDVDDCTIEAFAKSLMTASSGSRWRLSKCK